MRTYRCLHCKRETGHEHWRDIAYADLPQTHMAGSERFVCSECGLTTFASDDDGSSGFKFLYDNKE